MQQDQSATVTHYCTAVRLDEEEGGCVHAAVMMAVSMQERGLGAGIHQPQPGLTDWYKLPETQLQSLSDFTRLLDLPELGNVAQDDSHILRN